MNLLLVRDALSCPLRTFGTLTAASLVLQTLELPWVPDGTPGGHPDASCVPEGAYALVLHDTPEHPKTWALVNPALGVYHEPGDAPEGQPGRFACLIHTANVVEQLAGCVGVGFTRSLLNGEPDIASSIAAFSQLKLAVPWTQGHTLTIQRAAGGAGS